MVRGGRTCARASRHFDSKFFGRTTGVSPRRGFDRRTAVPDQRRRCVLSGVAGSVDGRAALGFKDHNMRRPRPHHVVPPPHGTGFPGEPFDAEQLLLEADAAPEACKSLGRNRVERTAITRRRSRAERGALPAVFAAVVQKLIAEGKLKTDRRRTVARIHTLARRGLPQRLKCSTSSRAPAFATT